jgi:ATP-dependent phosphoenolpyruvate carboxykinase
VTSGALTAYSGKKTGRSPLDKRIVKEETSEKNIWWGPVNKAMRPEVPSYIFFLSFFFFFLLPLAGYITSLISGSGMAHQ